MNSKKTCHEDNVAFANEARTVPHYGDSKMDMLLLSLSQQSYVSALWCDSSLPPTHGSIQRNMAHPARRLRTDSHCSAVQRSVFLVWSLGVNEAGMETVFAATINQKCLLGRPVEDHWSVGQFAQSAVWQGLFLFGTTVACTCGEK